MRRWNLAALAVGMLVLSNVALVLIGPTPDALAVSGGRASTARPGSPVGGLSARGSPRSLGPRQWIHSDDAMTFSIDGRPLGAAGTVTISALSQSWANADDTCLQVAFAAPEFPSAALRSAWVAAGLSTDPLAAQASGACEENTPGGGAFAGAAQGWGCSSARARAGGNQRNFSVHPSIDPGPRARVGPHGQHHVRPGGRSGVLPEPWFRACAAPSAVAHAGLHASVPGRTPPCVPSDSRCRGSRPSAQCTWEAGHRVRGHEGVMAAHRSS